jgi:inosine-uridine nucleoside N-ribohydrolase
MIKAWLFILLWFIGFQSIAAPRKVWIDTDIMIGKLKKDVDDGVALLLALRSDKIEIVGISIAKGVDYGYDITLKMLNWYAPGRNIPVYKGAKTAADSAMVTPASEALAAALKKDKLTIIAIGPCTNVRAALQQYPELQSQVEEIVFCMGRRPGATFSPGNGKRNLNDYNFDMDTKSMEYLLNTNIPLAFAGYEASSSIYIDYADLKFLKLSPNPGDQFLYKHLRRWCAMWHIYLGSKKGFIPFDAMTIGYVLNRDAFVIEENIPAEIQVLLNDSRYRQLGEYKPYLLASKELKSTRMVNYAGPAKPEYKEYLLRLMGKPVNE